MSIDTTATGTSATTGVSTASIDPTTVNPFGLRAPWLGFYNGVPEHIEYPDCSMSDMLLATAEKYADYPAYEFMNAKTSYRVFVEQIRACARAFCAMGIHEGDRVTICMPNTPQAIVAFYALNMIGALSNMVHPLSSEGEIEFFLNDSSSVAAITLDQFYDKFAAVRERTGIKQLIIASIKDELNVFKGIAYALTLGRKVKPIPADADIIYWSDFIKLGKDFDGEYAFSKHGADPAVILYSGGTTGLSKGVLLSNRNFNALALQTGAAGNCDVAGSTMLAIMPIFHGFGLGVCIHTILVHGCTCILIPRFNAKSYAKLLKTKQPNYIAGVPTLYEALLKNKEMDDVDLSCLKGMFSGGDSLSTELKKKVDTFLKEHGATIQVREGYGTTECVTASCLTPQKMYVPGSIGIPFPDTYYKIVKPYTLEEVPYGVDGEICIHGPSVMIGYVGNPKETAHTLQTHADGAVWLHTGDLGMMDENGFVYFKQRLKRMIISSGYSIYPSQLENIIDSHEAVLMSTVIGVDDPYKIQKVKAFVVLKPDCKVTDELKENIHAHCLKNIAKYAMPYEIEYRESLPTTPVGKIAYTVLEKEEREKNSANAANDADGATSANAANGDTKKDKAE